MPTPEPFLAGFHPDPSICRVGDTFYVVTSSFAYYPGLPIHRSTDLRTWELVGHVLTGDVWPDLDDVDPSDGVWAPTIREHDGELFVVFAVARQRRGAVTYVCTARDPRGPWTRTEVAGADGIDPSLFFDDDGRAWFTAARDSTTAAATGPAEIWLREFDIETRQLRGPEHIVWHGAVTGQWVEAPHVYRHDGVYWLLGAEGGTERNHAVTAARASAVTGPYTTDPRSPLLTHRHLGAEAPVQNVGHADLVTDAAGDTWAVLLGVRPVDGHHVLGRESFLVPVSWTAQGPVFAAGRGSLLDDGGKDAGDARNAGPSVLSLATGSTGSTPPVGAPGSDWMSLRGPVGMTVTGADVRLAPSPLPLTALGSPAFVGRRQTDHACRFAASIDTSSLTSEAGIVAFQNPEHYVAITVRRDGARSIAAVVQHAGGREHTLATVEVHGEARLAIDADERHYRFGMERHGEFVPLASVPASTLSTETAGGFVGVLLGLLSVGSVGDPETVFADVSYRAATEASELVLT